MSKLALFDLDGTLFNTEDVNYLAYSKALKEVGKEMDYQYYCQYCNGRKYTEFLPQILSNEQEIQQVHRKKKELYATFLDAAKINTHLFQLIQSLPKEYKIVIVTTASKKNTMDILEHFQVTQLFDDMITQEDIVHTKPNPEGFLKAMEKYQASKEETMIFEDSEVGILAAKKTGATVFKIEQF